MRKSNKIPFLVLRFGGSGDLMFCTPIIKQLHDDGFEVHVATNEYALPLLENNPYVAKAWAQPREGIVSHIDGKYPADLTELDGLLMPTIGLYDKYKSQPSRRGEAPLYPINAVNYFRVIENNTMHEPLWPTQAADFINTYDTHFSWAHIDPTSIRSTNRRPMYFPSKAELAWGAKALEFFPHPIIMLQPYASSPVRTFYRLTQVMDVLKKRDTCTVVIWDPSQTNPLSGNWRVVFFTKGGVVTDVNRVIPWPDKEITPHGMRASAALIANADLLVSADTCVSHIAEALKTFHLTYYTSVPAWTRSRDYEYEFTLESTATLNKDSARLCKCGIIGRDCPRKLMDAMGHLSQRERDILSLMNQQERAQMGIPLTEPIDLKGKQPHEHFVTTPQALQEELKSAVARYESLRQCEAPCSASLDVAGYLTWVLNSNRFNRTETPCEQ